MPSKSRSQQRLMQAAEHGATLPKAQALRQSMTPQQLHDFASGSGQDNPQHAPRHRLAGSHEGLFVTEHHRKKR